jgi:hypothetical protein
MPFLQHLERKETEDLQIALRWSHDLKSRRPTTKRFIQSQTQWKEKSRKTEIQVGEWGEQPGPRGQRLDALCSRQGDMERSSSTGLNQVLVVVPK